MVPMTLRLTQPAAAETKLPVMRLLAEARFAEGIVSLSFKGDAWNRLDFMAAIDAGAARIRKRSGLLEAVA